jgi:DNA-directed RNA polymerase specialized sigma24 family protein
MFTVRCQSASGQAHDVRVIARTESEACRSALRTLPADYRAVWALED